MKRCVVKSVIVRTLKMSFRSKSTIFWTVVFPLMLLLVITTLFVPSGGGSKVKLKLAMVPETNDERLTNLTKQYSEYLSNLKEYNDTFSFDINITILHCLNDSLDRLKKGDFDAVILIPKDAIQSLAENFTIKARIYVLTSVTDRMKEQLVKSVLTEFFRETAHYTAMGILYSVLNETAVYNPQLEKRFQKISKSIWENYDIEIINVALGKEKSNPRPLVIGWITLSVMFINFIFGGIEGGASLITSEIRHGFLHRLLSTRLKPSEYFAGLAISWIILLSITSTPTLIFGFLFLGGRLSINIIGPQLVYILLIILVSELFTFALGILVGIITRSPEGATVISNIISWVIMSLGGFWMPKWLLPEAIRWFADYNILSVLFYALSDIAVYGNPISQYTIPLSFSLIFSCITFIIAATIYTKYLPRLLEE